MLYRIALTSDPNDRRVSRYIVNEDEERNAVFRIIDGATRETEGAVMRVRMVTHDLSEAEVDAVRDQFRKDVTNFIVKFVD